MIKKSKSTRHERGWPDEAITLAKAAHANLFEALQSLRRERLVDPYFQVIYEDNFSEAEAILDNVHAYQIIPEAMEHFLRTGCDPYDKEAAQAVALQVVKGFLGMLWAAWHRKNAVNLRRSRLCH